jgi:hypothetical protein
MSLSSDFFYKVLQLMAWLIFVGLCIRAGGFLFNLIYVIFFNPMGAANFWEGMDLLALYGFDKGYFLVITGLMALMAGLKAWIFYLIIYGFVKKKMTLDKPFTAVMEQFISTTAYLSLAIGMLANLGGKLVLHLTKQGVILPDSRQLTIDGADVWLFMGVLLWLFVKIFRRGMALQAENDLTV